MRPDRDHENPDDVEEEEPNRHSFNSRNVCSLCGMSLAHVRVRPNAPCVPSLVVRVYNNPLGWVPTPGAWSYEPSPSETSAKPLGPIRPQHSIKERLANGPFIEVLEQRKWWRSGDGQLKRRQFMAIDYKVNALGYLMRNAGQIAADYTLGPGWHDAPEEVEADLNRINEAPEKWMLTLDMPRALLKDIMKFANIAPDDLGLQDVTCSTCKASLWLKR